MWSEIDSLVARLGIPERSASALYDAALGLRIRRSNYIRYTHVEDRTATRDLQLLVDSGLFVPAGERRARIYSATDRLRAVQIEARRQRPRPRDPYAEEEGMAGILDDRGFQTSRPL